MKMEIVRKEVVVLTPVGPLHLVFIEIEEKPQDQEDQEEPQAKTEAKAKDESESNGKKDDDDPIKDLEIFLEALERMR